MDKSSSAYVVVFAASVCIVLASGLAATFNGLKARIDKNKLFDKQRNVLLATGLYEPASGVKTQKELEQLFAERVEPKVIEFFRSDVEEKYRERGELKTRQVERITRAEETDIELAELAKARREGPKRILGELYVAKDGDKRVYCLPISGYGLWSTLYGFLALEQDRNTVRGITFYKHGETPGLGGEVEKDWWKDNWKGKRTHNDKGELVGITVLKGVGNEYPEDGHKVDGISGSTITCNGVTNFVKADLERYEAYFKGLN